MLLVALREQMVSRIKCVVYFLDYKSGDQWKMTTGKGSSLKQPITYQTGHYNSNTHSDKCGVNMGPGMTQ